MAQQRRPRVDPIRSVRIDLQEAQRLLDEATSGGAPNRVIAQLTKVRDGHKNRLRRQEAIKKQRDAAADSVRRARAAGR